MFVAICFSQRGGIDEVHMAFHQFGESVPGIGPGKLPQQFGIVHHFDFQLIAPPRIKTAQEKSGLTSRPSCANLCANRLQDSPVDLRKIWLARRKSFHFEPIQPRGVQR
jgi:hypothetical protein